LADKLKDADEKEFRKFVTSITQPLIEELSKVMIRGDVEIEPESIGIILQTVFKDFKAIYDLISRSISGSSLMD
jgi:hypothetical protein